MIARIIKSGRNSGLKCLSTGSLPAPPAPLSLPFPRYFSPNREPVHRLTITSFTVNCSVNAARSSCRRKFHGKGIKLKTFAPSYVISFPGVVVRCSRVQPKEPGSSPTQLFFFCFFFLAFCVVVFYEYIMNNCYLIKCN